MSKRTFTKQEKMSILKEASEQGVTKTLKKHGIYSTTYYSWKEKNKVFKEQINLSGLNKGAYLLTQQLIMLGQRVIAIQQRVRAQYKY